MRRLTPLDTAFLDVERGGAHMHVGWVALFAPPDDGPPPRFEELRDHIAARLVRAPRYRQRLAEVPLDLHDPVWVDDPDFDPDRHVRRATGDLDAVVDETMSSRLPRDRPLWELVIHDDLPGGRIAVVGRAHHCMVDGIAAVELGSLMLDPEPDPPRPPEDTWSPAPRPGALDLAVDAVRDRAWESAGVAGRSLRAIGSPSRMLHLGRLGLRAARALAASAAPARPDEALNQATSPFRHLARIARPLDDLKRVGRAHGTTVNDVVLAAAAGAVRRWMLRRGDDPARFKAMVPVNVRGQGDDLGNRISFMFVALPCDEPDALRRLRAVNAATLRLKDTGGPEGTDAVLRVLANVPAPVHLAVSRLVASPRAFNLVVSNIPGPAQPLFMRGCRLEEAYPVVPLADRHALAIGMTTVRGRACFGLYADRVALPDSDVLAADLDAELDELLARSGAGPAPRPGRPPERVLEPV